MTRAHYQQNNYGVYITVKPALRAAVQPTGTILSTVEAHLKLIIRIKDGEVGRHRTWGCLGAYSEEVGVLREEEKKLV